MTIINIFAVLWFLSIKYSECRKKMGEFQMEVSILCPTPFEGQSPWSVFFEGCRALLSHKPLNSLGEGNEGQNVTLTTLCVQHSALQQLLLYGLWLLQINLSCYYFIQILFNCVLFTIKLFQIILAYNTVLNHISFTEENILYYMKIKTNSISLFYLLLYVNSK